MRFSAPVDHWTVLRLNAEDYPPRRELPAGYEFAAAIDRDAERRLLELEFPQWQIPFERRMPGAREDGVVTVVHGGEPVGITFATDANELGIKGYGQVTYGALDPAHRGSRIGAAMFDEAAQRVLAWGLAGVILIPDRAGHVEMYLRWGAQVIGIRPKQERATRAARLGLRRR